MKGIVKRLGILAAVSLIVFFAGCNTDMKTFTRNWGGLTDGEISYSFLPHEYDYRGDMKKLVGFVDGGSAVCSSEDGLFIKENESIFQDVPNNELVRDDFKLPKPEESNCEAVFVARGGAAALSDTAKEELFWLFEMLDTAKPNGELKNEDGCEYLGFFRLDFNEPAGLSIAETYRVYRKDGRLCVSSHGRHAFISPTSRLYEETDSLTIKVS